MDYIGAQVGMISSFKPEKMVCEMFSVVFSIYNLTMYNKFSCLYFERAIVKFNENRLWFVIFSISILFLLSKNSPVP